MKGPVDGTKWRWIIFGRFSWQRLVRSTLIIYGIIALIGLFFAEHFIFPYRDCSYDKSLPGLEMITSEDGTAIATRYVEVPDAPFLVLHFHGNYEDLGQLEPLFEIFRERGFSTLGMDYRGCGLSEGLPKEASCYQDAEALYQQARLLGYRPEQILIWGRSVGSGLAVELATRHQVKALVLESPFSTAFRVATRVPLAPFDKFHNLKKMRSLEEPLFILHGTDDEIIPAWHSEKLYQRHQGPKERHLVEGAGHNDLWMYPLDDEWAALDAFLAEQEHRQRPYPSEAKIEANR